MTAATPKTSIETIRLTLNANSRLMMGYTAADARKTTEKGICPFNTAEARESMTSTYR